ncbi:hypothetical protein K7I13_04280 [Brucepastera parasyntrophica]|uniref:hypothetical protein n=1 Tax=Brucepastera parasyntrophica TaxID=2880008 RepID=UPI00210D7E09|nr:hypothetical protein [Brucepastera parasyntrophica]ULQ60523.1 hypothetical protein K7I13_04280 [Brucepastera parasyntrophica]
MLEIPETRTIAEQCNSVIRGKKIRFAQANASPHGFAFYHDDPASYPALLEGSTIGETYAYSGMVEVEAGKTRLLIGDGINMRYLAPEKEPPKKHQLYILFEDSSSIVCTIQMYGGIWVYSEGENDNPYYLIAKQKPNPLTDEFTESYFMDLFDGVKPSMSAKGFLATEQRIPGLGNGVLQDILFNARVNPKTKIQFLDTGEKRVFSKA